MKKNKQKKHTLAMALSAVMVLNTMPIFAEEVNTKVSEYIHDTDCNYTEGLPCIIHDHTQNCYKVICNNEAEDHSHNDECFELNCTHIHITECKYVEAKDCSCMKPSEDNKQIKCTLDEECNLFAEHEGECVKASLDNQRVIKVSGWVFNEADILSEGVLALPGVNSTKQIDFETLVGMLPKEITVLEGDTSVLEIISWSCPEFVIDEDKNWPINGEYIFKAELPEGYEFETQPSVKVVLGGAELYDVEIVKTVGDFIVIGDENQYGWKDSVLTIKNGATLTIQNTDPTKSTTHRIVVEQGATNVNITLDGVNIDVSESGFDIDSCAFDMTGAEVTLTLKEGSNNTLISNGDRAGLEVPEGAKLIIDGSGTLTAKGDDYGAGIGGKGTDGKGDNGGNITIMGNVVVNAEGDNGAAIGGGRGDTGDGGNGGEITIKEEAQVTAKSSNGAGIGGGQSNNAAGGNGGKITIKEETQVTANSTYGAGIGGGSSNSSGDAGGNGGKITIEGKAIVEAKSTQGAGIGGGRGNSGAGGTGGSGGTVEISGKGTKVIADGMAAIGSARPFNMTGNGGTLSVTKGATLELKTGNPNAETVSYEDCTIIHSNGAEIQYDENSKAKPNLTLQATTNGNEVASGDLTVTATLTGTYGGNESKSIKFTSDKHTINDGNVVVIGEDGKATYTFSDLTPESYTLTATYDGDSNNNSATASINVNVKAAPTLQLEVSPNNSQTYPGDVTLIATLSGADGGNEGKSIKFYGHGDRTVVTGEGGKATYTISDLKPNSYTFTATFDGDETNLKASSKEISYNVVLPVVDIKAIQGVKVPVRGETAVKVITQTEQYTGSIQWSPALTTDGKFAAATEYTATITLSVINNYTLDGIDKDFFTVNGALSVETNGNVITAKFPKTGTSSTTSGPKNTYQSISDTINQTISSSNIKSLIRNKKSLTLNSNKGSMTFEPAALKAILDVIPSSARKIMFTAVPKEVYTDQNGLKIYPIYDFSISYKDSKGKNIIVNVDFPKGSASIALNYIPASNEKSESIFMVNIDEKGNVIWLDQSSYKDGKVMAEVEHYSIYGIAYKASDIAYVDVKGHWAESDIQYVLMRNILASTENQTFSPDASMTQGMLVTALQRFNNIDPKEYIKEYKPEAYLTREQMAVILAEYMKKSGYTIPSTLKTVKYVDQQLISSSARSSVKAMQQAGIVKGKTGNLYDPQGYVTKGQGAAMLHRLIEVMIDPTSANGWQKNDSGQRLFYEKGKVVTGWQTIDQLTYYFNETGEMHEGWKLNKKKWYYWTKDGAVIGWKFINGKWYYFMSDGVMASNTWIEGYQLGNDGAWIK